MDKNLYAVAAAFISAKDDDKIIYPKLIKNVRSCLRNFEKSITGKEIIEFRSNFIFAALASCPSIRQLFSGATNPKIEGIFNAFPPLSNEAFILLILGPTYHNLIYPIVKEIPPIILADLIMCLISLSKKTSLDSLSLLTEFTKALFYSIHHRAVDCSVIEKLFESVKKYLISFNEEAHKEINKCRSYLFLHTVQLLQSIISMPIDNVSSEELIGAFNFSDNHSNPVNDTCALTYSIESHLLEFCQNIVDPINIDTWVSWNEINYMTAQSSIDNDSVKQIQTVISHTVHEILLSISLVKCNDVPQHNDDYNLYTALSDKTEVHTFFKHIAADPNYDPDIDMKFEELSEQLKDLLLEKKGNFKLTSKQLKYLSMLIFWNDSTELFESQLTCDIILSCSINEELVCELFDKFIHYPGEVSSEWKKTIIKSCEVLSVNTLKGFLTTLVNKHGLKNWLEFEFYSDYLREVCNCVVSGDSLQISKVFLACLQRPLFTLDALVDQAVNKSGMVNVTVQILQNFTDFSLVEGTLLFEVFRHFNGISNEAEHQERYLNLIGQICQSESVFADAMLSHTFKCLEDNKTLLHWKIIQICIRHSLPTYPKENLLKLIIDSSEILVGCSNVLLNKTDDKITIYKELFAQDSNSITNNEDLATTNQSITEPPKVNYKLVAEFLDLLNDVLNEIVKNNSANNDENLRKSLQEYFQSSDNYLTASIYAILQPMLQGDVKTIDSVNCVSAALIIRLHAVGDVDAAQNIIKENNWNSITWIASLTKVLLLAPTSDWQHAFTALGNADQFSEMGHLGTIETHDISFVILRSVLELHSVTLDQNNFPEYIFIRSYKNFTTALINEVKSSNNSRNGFDKISFICKTFVWWCQNYVNRNNSEVVSIPCLKLLDIFKETIDAESSLKEDRIKRVVREMSGQFVKHMPRNGLSKQISMVCLQMLETS